MLAPFQKLKHHRLRVPNKGNTRTHRDNCLTKVLMDSVQIFIYESEHRVITEITFYEHLMGKRIRASTN